MTRDELKTIIAVISRAYPKLFVTPDKEMVDLWFMLLEDIAYSEAQTAVVAWIREEKYPPAISDICGKIFDYKNNSRISGDEAFQLVRQAVRRHGYCSPGEARDFLGEEIWSVVERYGWDYFCTYDTDNVTTVQAQFARLWDHLEEKKHRYAVQSPSIQARIEAMRPQSLPPCLEEKNTRRSEK